MEEIALLNCRWPAIAATVRWWPWWRASMTPHGERRRTPARSAVLAAAAHVLRSQQCAFGTSSSWQRAHRC